MGQTPRIPIGQQRPRAGAPRHFHTFSRRNNVTAYTRHCEEAAQCAEYFRNSRSHMRYLEFRAQVLCVGSGVVEAGTRLKRSGMQWSEAGASAALTLRCCRLSGRFEDFRAKGFASADASLADAGADAPAPG